MINGIMMQFFHWYNEPGGKLWDEIADRAESLAALGTNAVWLPPAYKAKDGGYSNGYDTYDLFDLAEFDQKGTRRSNSRFVKRCQLEAIYYVFSRLWTFD